MKVKFRRSNNKKYMLYALALMIVVLGLLIFYLQTRPSTDVQTIPVNTDQSQPTNTNGSDPPANTTTSPTNSNSQKQQNAPIQSGGDLIAPYGSFVSNHKPNLGGNPAPSQMQSTCSTTPGAKCIIKFTKDSSVKSLPEQTIGSDGSTTWDWDINSAGLTQGSWEITATATLAGKTMATKDTINIEVSP